MIRGMGKKGTGTGAGIFLRRFGFAHGSMFLECFEFVVVHGKRMGAGD